ncbi:MAG: RAMP superfamily CRISPR-associated protein [Anaerolineae bacterium]|nr:RAMP superfamily CRISPR-associated protein [Anaerolineae bacterium]
MKLTGKLIAESPIYRGNARKTLFTRDLDGTHRLVSLPGEIAGTAQALMDAFIGEAPKGRNIGLLHRQWARLYGEPLPRGLITAVQCQLAPDSYPRERFFDLRMGLKLDDDRWAAEANANYKMETVFRNAEFNFVMQVSDAGLAEGDNAAKLYYLLEELARGRFWFGAGKSKGLGRVRLELDTPLPQPVAPPKVREAANHLRLQLTFNATNPVLVGWNWGKVDPEKPAFAAIDGKTLVEAMRQLSPQVRQGLALVLGGPILSPADWKKRFSAFLPQVIAIYLRKQSQTTGKTWTLPKEALKRLAKGKYGLPEKVLAALEPLCDTPFPSQEAAEEAINAALGKKANMAPRVLQEMVVSQAEGFRLNQSAWQAVAADLGLTEADVPEVEAALADERALKELLAAKAVRVLPSLLDQVDQQIRLLQSDVWIDAEIAAREEHLKIKQLLLEGKISERQWNDPHSPPAGVSAAAWREFLAEHRRVQYHHMIAPANLRKSINNDRNFIAFLTTQRARARQELVQPKHIDFRSGGPFGSEVSRKYGKPYDTLFMRMLSWTPSAGEDGGWEIYIPGSTIKGAFRRRAGQVLRTLWGESPRTEQVLDHLFGKQGQRGAVHFSDAYLVDPDAPDHVWCSMDGVKMDPTTGRPVEEAKHDFLFAYGRELVFQLQLDLQDIAEEDLEAIAVLEHLLRDFQAGDIPIGGEKTSGFGWVQAEVRSFEWLTGSPGGVSRRLFGERRLTRSGVWHRLYLEGADAQSALSLCIPLAAERLPAHPPRAQAGFVSHRAFGGYCGVLMVGVDILTPTHVRESGEPSFATEIDGRPVYGWDTFSMAPPAAGDRPSERRYAFPSLSLKGMLRHVYAIASDSRSTSPDLSRLNPVDSLFGWVGPGPNQAIMGRVSLSFAFFDPSPQRAWFALPYPYTGWRFQDGRWEERRGNGVPQVRVGERWRVFLHAPLAPTVRQMERFHPDTAQAVYFQAILPGQQARFAIRFWNLSEEELQRLIWCVELEPELAHKLGKGRHMGFGSLRLRILPESYLVDWRNRYAVSLAPADARGRVPLALDQWRNPQVVAYLDDLRRVMNAQHL